jgi:hypothetical protein
MLSLKLVFLDGYEAAGTVLRTCSSFVIKQELLVCYVFLNVHGVHHTCEAHMQICMTFRTCLRQTAWAGEDFVRAVELIHRIAVWCSSMAVEDGVGAEVTERDQSPRSFRM